MRCILIKSCIYSRKKITIKYTERYKRHGKPSNPITISGRLETRTMKLPNSDSSNLIRLASGAKPFRCFHRFDRDDKNFPLQKSVVVALSSKIASSSAGLPTADEQFPRRFTDGSPLLDVRRPSSNFPDKYAIGFQA